MARFMFDGALCSKCHSCEVACAVWHQLPAGEEGFRRVEEIEVGAFPFVRRLFTSKALAGCDLCKDCGGSPRCAQTCPTGALRFE